MSRHRTHDHFAHASIWDEQEDMEEEYGFDDEQHHHTIQFKLSIGATNDPLEYEADAVADKVMSSVGSSIFGSGHKNESKDTINRRQLSSQISRSIQKKSNGSGETVPDDISNKISETKGGGSPLPPQTQSFMEGQFGTDFSGVKVHTGNDAAKMSEGLNAQAFTVGQDIYFNEGKFAPGSSEGNHLLAHELTHTVQQGVEGMVMKKEKKPCAENKQNNSSSQDDKESEESKDKDDFELLKKLGTIYGYLKDIDDIISIGDPMQNIQGATNLYDKLSQPEKSQKPTEIKKTDIDVLEAAYLADNVYGGTDVSSLPDCWQIVKFDLPKNLTKPPNKIGKAAFSPIDENIPDLGSVKTPNNYPISDHETKLTEYDLDIKSSQPKTHPKSKNQLNLVILGDGRIVDFDSGFKAAMYKKTGKDKSVEYAFVTAGTDLDNIPDAINDLLTDERQGRGKFTTQYHESIQLAMYISKNLLGDQRLTFIGHSLGGGLAAANALATGRPAITFNAAALNEKTKSSNGLNGKHASIDNYEVEKQIVFYIDAIGFMFPEGRNHVMEDMYENGILDRHTMKAVIDAIKWMKTQASLEKRYKEKEKKELLNILKELAKEKIIFPSNRDPIDQLNHK